MKTPKSVRPLTFLVLLLLALGALALTGVTFGVRVQAVDNPPPSPTSISCSVFPTSLALGNSATVNGSISPSVSNVTVKLTYTKPDGTTITRTTTTGADGSFSDAYVPDTAGSWSVKANWDGNDSYLASTSFDATFTVTGGSALGISMEYVYIIIVIVIVIVAAAALFLYRKRK